VNNETPAAGNSRLRRYGHFTGLVAVFAALLFFKGDPPNLIIMKLTAVPLFFLAQSRVKQFPAPEASSTPWTAAFVERTVLSSLAFMCWLTIFVWQPDVSALRIAVTFLVGVVAMSAMFTLMASFDHKRANKAKQ
jgi:hypothetical protein